MSQHDFNISNQTASVTRADINNALGALATLSSGANAPATTYANMLWYETDTNTLRMRNEADSGWIRIGYLNQSGAFSVFLGTDVVRDDFTVVGSVGFQTTGSWEAGTSFDISLVSPAQVKAAILALSPAPISPIGVSQSWSSVSRVSGTSYRNTTGKAVQITATVKSYNSGSPDFSPLQSNVQVSSNNSTWFTLASTSTEGGIVNASAIIPDDHYYRFNGQYDNFSLLS